MSEPVKPHLSQKMAAEMLPKAVQIHPVGTRVVLTSKVQVQGGEKTEGITGTVLPHDSLLFSRVALDTPVDGYSILLLDSTEYTLMEPTE